MEVAAHVAQLVEHILGKDEVSGSIPLMGSILNAEARANKCIYRDLTIEDKPKRRTRRVHHGQREI
jgi:hypothetical protein